MILVYKPRGSHRCYSIFTPGVIRTELRPMYRGTKLAGLIDMNTFILYISLGERKERKLIVGTVRAVREST